MAAEELYRNYCDLVCEGGGVKGIGLAGAFSVLEEPRLPSAERGGNLGSSTPRARV